jgi:hypothetical protein
MNKHESRIHFLLIVLSQSEYFFFFKREYLKGFHKRKLERRERAQKELEDEIKNDLKILRQKVKFQSMNFQ